MKALVKCKCKKEKKNQWQISNMHECFGCMHIHAFTSHNFCSSKDKCKSDGFQTTYSKVETIHFYFPFEWMGTRTASQDAMGNASNV